MSWDDVADAIDRITDEPPDSDRYLRPAVKILAEKFVGEHAHCAGVNASSNWDFPFGTGQVHIGVTAFSDTAAKWRRTVDVAPEQAIGLSGVAIIKSLMFRFWRWAAKSRSVRRWSR